MISDYSNTFFPICSFIISLFLFVLFFFKKNIKNTETSIYSRLIVVGLVESSYYVVLTLLVDFVYKDSLYTVFQYLNKILGIIYYGLMKCYIIYLKLLN